MGIPESPLTERRRSCLAVPGSDPRKLAKALRTGADELVLDLEDAVPVSRKDAARELVSTWLAGADRVAGLVTVRVNAPRTPWCHHDLEACVRGGARSVVLPKVESAGDLHFVERLLDGIEAAAGRREPVAVQALIETAAGLARVAEIAAASSRLRTVIIGYADLAASLGRGPDAPAESWWPAQHAVLVAARAAGLQAIDGPHLGVADDASFRASVRSARQLGFDGKWVIHPGQIGLVNEAFTPTSDEIERARAVLDALRQAESGGSGAVALDGQMIDEAAAVAARRVLARAGE